MNLYWNTEDRTRRAAMWRAIWPDPPTSFSYLGNVADEVGEILFPDEWSPIDMWLPSDMVPRIGPSPSRRLDGGREALGERMQADLALRRHGHPRPGTPATNGTVEVAPLGDGSAEDNANLVFTEEEWLLAVELLANEHLHMLLAYKRSRRVRRLIAEAAERGEVRISYRHKDGGHTHPTEPHWWSTPNLVLRFQTYSINPADPFSSTTPEARDRHDLFVHKDDRAKLLMIARTSVGAEQAASTLPSNIPSGIYLSPYILLAIEVIQEAGITAIEHSNVESLITVIKLKMEQRGLPPSHNLAKGIATIIRAPEAQLGKAKGRN